MLGISVTYSETSVENICKYLGHAVFCEWVGRINTEVAQEALIHFLSTPTRKAHCSQHHNIQEVNLCCVFQVIPKVSIKLLVVIIGVVVIF
jgi:hypothetical protein